jgi:predicted nucleic acid-binding Zn ribbon protein
MALFTNKADRKLPLLTQFCQLEIIKTSDEYEGDLPFVSPELDRFLFLFGENFSDKAYSEEGLWSSGEEIKLHDHAPNLGWNDHMLLIQHILNIFMRAHITKDFSEIKEEFEEIEVFMDILDSVIISYQSQEYIIYTESANFKAGKDLKYHDLNILPCLNLASQIADELIDLAKKSKPARFCAECRNPFVVMKEDQRFCSARCRQRQGQRIRMRKLFER